MVHLDGLAVPIDLVHVAVARIEVDPKNPIFIKTVRGRGYAWCTDVEQTA